MNIKDFVGGWFIGNFEPSILKTSTFEVGLKIHPKGEKWDVHYHKIAVEYNLLVSGSMTVNGKLYNSGDIFILDRNEVCSPEFLEDCTIVTVKVPSVIGDKYVVE
jgi:hypothetical protein